MSYKLLIGINIAFLFHVLLQLKVEINQLRVHLSICIFEAIAQAENTKRLIQKYHNTEFIFINTYMKIR